MRWINALGIVPLAMVLAAVLARLSQLNNSRIDDHRVPRKS